MVESNTDRTLFTTHKKSPTTFLHKFTSYLQLYNVPLITKTIRNKFRNDSSRHICEFKEEFSNF